MPFHYLALEAFPARILLLLLPLIIWEAIWKGIALWKAGSNRQLVWFIFIFLINSLGILPIVYLLNFQKKPKSSSSSKKRRKNV